MREGKRKLPIHVLCRLGGSQKKLSRPRVGVVPMYEQSTCVDWWGYRDHTFL